MSVLFSFIISCEVLIAWHHIKLPKHFRLNMFCVNCHVAKKDICAENADEGQTFFGGGGRLSNVTDVVSVKHALRYKKPTGFKIMRIDTKQNLSRHNASSSG